MKTKKGFTLVELLVVIAILAILATATIVGFTAFTQKAKQSNLEGELKQVTEMLQLEDYYNSGYEIVGKKIVDGSGNNFTKETFSSLINACSDEELQHYSGRLVYTVVGTVEDQHVVLILLDDATDHELQAMWDLSTGKITSGKYDNSLNS